MRRIMIVGMAVAALLAAVGQAGAYFIEQASVPDNVITCGTVAVSCEPTAGVLSVPALAPGDTVSNTLTVRNTGTLATNVIVTGAKKAGYTALYEALTCRVTHGTDVLFEGGLATLRTLPVGVGTGASADLVFELGLPADADDALAGDYVRMTLYVDAEQVHE